MNSKAMVFDIQGFSVHDGPGCRTTIFLKGCPMRCLWCCNPEGISPRQELMYSPSRCCADLVCRDTCPHNAVTTTADGYPQFDRSRCQPCLDYPCIDSCPTRALDLSGYCLSIDEAMKTLERDRTYWEECGGMTLSGGEPMLQFDFTRELLHECHKRYIHTAMETCGYAPIEHFHSILPFTDWIFIDLKHMDEAKHQDFTGVSNRLVLANARSIAQNSSVRLIFRMPLLPGFNDDEKNLMNTALFLKELGKTELNVLPLHHLGSSKYERLNQTYLAQTWAKPSPQKLNEIGNFLQSQGITCYLGNNMPF